MTTPKDHVIVLGAGISGLQTSLSLLQAGYRVTIIAQHTPGEFSPDYTSPWAGGHWRSHAGTSPADATQRSFDARTYQAWTTMLNNEYAGVNAATKLELEKEMGIGFRECRYYWGTDDAETEGRDGRGIWFRTTVANFGVLNLQATETSGMEKVPEGAVMGITYKSICFNPLKYLLYLFKRVKKLGAQVIKAQVDCTEGLIGVANSCKALIFLQYGVTSDAFVLVNCAGLAARHFLRRREAEKLFPVRGQTILVKGEAGTMRTFVGIPGAPASEMLYVVPRPGSNTTILGGCKQVGDWNKEVDKAMKERIVAGIKRFGLCDELRGEDGEFDIVNDQVGFRPGRTGGPRVEGDQGVDEDVKNDEDDEDNDFGSGDFDGLWVVHNYGHAGAGFQGSVGCAERVVEYVGKMRRAELRGEVS